MEKKLTIAHLAPYFPYGLKMRFENETGREITLTGIHGGDGFAARISDGRHGYWLEDSGFKPVLKPIHLFANRNSQTMNDLNCGLYCKAQIRALANKSISYESMDWSAMEVCFRNHIDVFGLIDAGLAIEK